MPIKPKTGILCFVLALMLVLPSVAGAEIASSEEFSFKIAVESHLEDRLNTVLSEIAGTEEILVIVNADVRTDTTARNQTRPKPKKQNRLVLPGVPVKKELGKEKTTKEVQRELPDIPTLVNRLDVTILVDKDVPESLTEIAHDVAIAVIGYNPDRGDKLSVKRFDFGREGFAWSTIVQPPHLYWVLGFILTGFFLVAAAMFLMNPFKKLSTSMQSIDWRGMFGGPVKEESSEEGGKQAPLTVALTQSGFHEKKETLESGKPMPFYYVTADNLNEAAFLLKDDDPRNIAIVANYLGAELATRLFELLPDEKSTEAAILLSSSTIAEASAVEQLDSRLKSRLDFVVGGGDKLSSILSLTPEEVRDKVFEALESRDPDAAEAIKRTIKTFESIIRSAKPLTIQILYRQVDPTSLARVLKSSPGDIQNKVLESLTEGASDMLSEEMELSRPFTKNRLRKEKLAIVMAYRRLLNAGLIEEEEG